MSEVLVEHDDGLVIITINRPEAKMPSIAPCPMACAQRSTNWMPEMTCASAFSPVRGHFLFRYGPQGFSAWRGHAR